MAIEVKYTCGTCGMEIFESELEVKHNKKVYKVVDEKKLWHECSDGYVVPLQSVVEKVKHEPVQKKDSK